MAAGNCRLKGGQDAFPSHLPHPKCLGSSDNNKTLPRRNPNCLGRWPGMTQHLNNPTLQVFLFISTATLYHCCEHFCMDLPSFVWLNSLLCQTTLFIPLHEFPWEMLLQLWKTPQHLLCSYHSTRGREIYWRIHAE